MWQDIIGVLFTLLSVYLALRYVCTHAGTCSNVQQPDRRRAEVKIAVGRWVLTAHCYALLQEDSQLVLDRRTAHMLDLPKFYQHK